MGSEVMAYCACGTRATSLIGSGKIDFRENNFFPAHCKRCSLVVQANLKEKPVSCPDCDGHEVTPYTEPDLAKGDGDRNVATWGENILTNGHYHCPACGDYTLRFYPTGLH